MIEVHVRDDGFVELVGGGVDILAPLLQTLSEVRRKDGKLVLPWSALPTLKTMLPPGHHIRWVEVEDQRQLAPAHLRLDLRPYQLEGVKFALAGKFGRAFIGDDTGLGKTPQAIAWAESIGEKPVLVLAPSSLIPQWEEQLGKFLGTPDVSVVTGSKEERMSKWFGRGWILANYRKVLFDTLPQVPVVILDEPTHREAGLKNHQSKTFRVMRKWIKDIPWRLMLSATPVENSIMEFYNLLELLFTPLPHPWGSRVWFNRQHVIWGRFNNIEGFKNVHLLQPALSMFFIRRRKEHVLKELPEVLDDIFVDPGLTKEQLAAYRRESALFLSALEHRAKNPGSMKPLAHLNNLINILSGCYKALPPSKVARFKAFEEVLDMIPQGEKAVLFCRTASEQVPWELARRHPRVVVPLTGRVPQDRRADLIKAFFESDEARVLAVNDGVGAYGLNLQGASVVINWDWPWNPAIAAPVTVNKGCQRLGRVYRMGQTKPITVISMLTRGTVEERIMRLLWQKRYQFNTLIEKASKKEWESLLALNEGAIHAA